MDKNVFNKCEKPSVTEASTGSKATSEDGIPFEALPILTPIDSAAEKRLLRKLDLRVVPVIAFLYMLAFVDRINIGNARIQGLEKDLNMRGQDYNVALCVFFIPYILFEVPSNLLIRKFAPSTWLTSIMVLWGVVTVCQGLTRSYAGLVVCRVLLGLFEAGFFPGCMYLISMYYKRYELQWRFNLFFCTSILSGAFSGVTHPSAHPVWLLPNADPLRLQLLAYALANMAGIGGYNGWRWIFIIEGLATIVAALFARPFIVDWPEKSRFLTPDERQLLLRRLKEDISDVRMDRLDKNARRRAFSDWKIYLSILMYLGVTTTGYSTAYFTPTILFQLGWTSVRAQIMSIPIYLVAATFSLAAAYVSDILRHRFGFIMLGICVATTGYIVLLAQLHSAHAVSVPGRYVAIYLIMAGGYIAQPITLVWVNNNMAGHYKRSISAAMQVGFGNLGGIVASNIYITAQKPTYPVGYGVSLGLLWLTAAAACALLLGLWVENRKRDRGARDYRFDLSAEEVGNLGDEHPRFRFVY
ncbi:MAG: hypothetical protein Q9163_003494 [Psora crenata]